MELIELLSSIIDKNVPKFTVFVGADYEVMNIYIKQMATVTNRKIASIESVSNILNTTHKSIIKEQPKLYVCKYNKSIITDEKLYTDIEAKLKDNYLILVYTELDLRSKFSNVYKKNIVSFAPQNETRLLLMLKDIDLSEDSKLRLIQGCSNNYGRILNELKKVDVYHAMHTDMLKDDVLALLLQKDVIKLDVGDILFEFINSVVARQPKKSYRLYTDLQQSGESNIKIISLLYSEFKYQLMVESTKPANFSTTGLNGGVLQRCYKRCNRFSVKELLRCVKLIRDVEQGIKTGLYDELVSVDYILARIL